MAAFESPQEHRRREAEVKVVKRFIRWLISRPQTERAVDSPPTTCMQDQPPQNLRALELVRRFVEAQSPEVINPLNHPTAETILQTDPPLRMAVLIECLRWQADCARLTNPNHDQRVGIALAALSARLMRKRIDWTQSDLLTVLHFAGRPEHLHGPAALPIASIVTAATRWIEIEGINLRLRRGLNRMLIGLSGVRLDAEIKRQVARIDRLLGHRDDPQTIQPGEAWADQALQSLEAMTAQEQQNWSALIQHALLATTSKPTASWLSVCRKKIEPIGAEAFRETVVLWISHLGEPATSPSPIPHDPTLIGEANSTILRGLIWATGLLDGDALHEAVRLAAERCFAKIPNHGQRNPKVGNACVRALAHAGAIEQLEQLQSKTVYPSVRQTAQKALEQIKPLA